MDLNTDLSNRLSELTTECFTVHYFSALGIERKFTGTMLDCLGHCLPNDTIIMVVKDPT